MGTGRTDVMIRAVLDANVIASGLVGYAIVASTPGEILRRWRSRAFTLVLGAHLLEEVERTLQKPYFTRRLSPDVRWEEMRRLRTDAEIVTITVQVTGIATHPEDDLVLATAVSAQADYLVTGDGGPLGVGEYEGVTIVTPRQFLDRLTAPERDEDEHDG